MDLLLVRHGLPERIVGADGPADPLLPDEGRRQSERLADWLAHERVDHLMSSTLRRAQQTAAPVGDRLGLGVELVQGLSEFDADADSYIPIEELRQTRDPRFFALVEGRWDELGSTVDPSAFADLVHTTIGGVIGAFPASGLPSCATAAWSTGTWAASWAPNATCGSCPATPRSAGRPRPATATA